MLRRFGFLLSICGLMFGVVPMMKVLEQPDFVTFAIGAGFTLLGIFVGIESVDKQNK